MKRLTLRAFTLVACACASTAVGSAAHATDLNPRGHIYKAPPAPIYAPPYNWTGFYIGGNGGYAWGKADVGSSSGDSNGWMFGATAGFNQQIGQWVWGFEGDFDYALNQGQPGQHLRGTLLRRL